MKRVRGNFPQIAATFFSVVELDAQIRDHAMAAATEEADAMVLLNDEGSVSQRQKRL